MSMVGHIAGVADQVRERLGLQEGRLHPFYVARAAGALVGPGEGLREAAVFDRATYSITYDERHPGWREAVMALACGCLLQEAGLLNTNASRAMLAQLLGTPTDFGGSGEHEPIQLAAS